MFTKTGNSFLAQKQYAAGISRALHLELGDTHQATKTLMRWTNANGLAPTKPDTNSPLN